MTKLIDGLILVAAICMGLAWIASTPAQADEPSFPVKTQRDEFACPGMHAEWLDEKTVHCLKESQ